jgi:putative ABC transport system substrate-binding protein
MKRRTFIAGLASVAAWPVAAQAQQAGLPVIGFLNSASPAPYAGNVRAFRQGLNESGYVEGQNVLIEPRWAEGQFDRLSSLAADLVRRKVAVIAANQAAAVAAKAATTTIPIVFVMAGDPIEMGLVASLRRPGANLTGITSLGGELGPKRLELIHLAVPDAHVIALLVNPTSPNSPSLTESVQTAARTLGLDLQVLQASTEGDFDRVFAAARRLQPAALVIGPDSFLTSENEQLARLALRHGVPAIAQFREFAAAGGLMSYGGDIADNYRVIGVYAGRILKGEKPADLPVQQATKVELVINMKTAKALGLTFPLTLLGRADEVIE